MSEDTRAVELLELEKTTRKLNEIIEGLKSVKEQMIKFAYALETDPSSICFSDPLKTMEQENQFEFNLEELSNNFSIKRIEQEILLLSELSAKKRRLEGKLGVTITMTSAPE